MSIELEHLRKLPIAEKLRIVEELWDDIHESEGRATLHSWHRVESLARAAELEAMSETTLTREELWKQVDD